MDRGWKPALSDEGLQREGCLSTSVVEDDGDGVRLDMEGGAILLASCTMSSRLLVSLEEANTIRTLEGSRWRKVRGGEFRPWRSRCLRATAASGGVVAWSCDRPTQWSGRVAVVCAARGG